MQVVTENALVATFWQGWNSHAFCGVTDKLAARVIRYSPDCNAPSVSLNFVLWICSSCLKRHTSGRSWVSVSNTDVGPSRPPQFNI
jgi:hypothetical protein